MMPIKNVSRENSSNFFLIPREHTIFYLLSVVNLYASRPTENAKFMSIPILLSTRTNRLGVPILLVPISYCHIASVDYGSNDLNVASISSNCVPPREVVKTNERERISHNFLRLAGLSRKRVC